MPQLSVEPKPVGYLRESQLKDLKDDRKYLVAQAKDPNIQERGDVLKAIKRLDHQVATQTAPILSPEGRDQIEKERRELEAYIQDGMPSHEEMRKNPHGAVGKHIRHQKLKLQAELRWKDVMRMLHPGNDDPDLCSVERIRPTTSTLGMHDAQIPGKQFHFAPNTDEYREQWDKIFGKATPAEILQRQQSLEQRLEEISARLDEAEEAEAGAKPAPEAEVQTSAPTPPARSRRAPPDRGGRSERAGRDLAGPTASEE
jgi:hypothetical protein